MPGKRLRSSVVAFIDMAVIGHRLKLIASVVKGACMVVVNVL